LPICTCGFVALRTRCLYLCCICCVYVTHVAQRLWRLTTVLRLRSVCHVYVCVVVPPRSAVRCMNIPCVLYILIFPDLRSRFRRWVARLLYAVDRTTSSCLRLRWFVAWLYWFTATLVCYHTARRHACVRAAGHHTPPRFRRRASGSSPRITTVRVFTYHTRYSWLPRYGLARCGYHATCIFYSTRAHPTFVLPDTFGYVTYLHVFVVTFGLPTLCGWIWLTSLPRFYTRLLRFWFYAFTHTFYHVMRFATLPHTPPTLHGWFPRLPRSPRNYCPLPAPPNCRIVRSRFGFCSSLVTAFAFPVTPPLPFTVHLARFVRRCLHTPRTFVLPVAVRTLPHLYNTSLRSCYHGLPRRYGLPDCGYARLTLVHACRSHRDCHTAFGCLPYCAATRCSTRGESINM